MEFKKCIRCGNFFVSLNNDVCSECAIKDRNDVAKLNSILNTMDINSTYELSINSGIKENTINRFIQNKSIEF